jgi:hypothetical protein
MSTQKIAHAARLFLPEAADQGEHHRDPGRGREEVLCAECEHLRQIAHGRLAAITLPVGVGDEADGGVE